jgi:hypothetical protein
VCESRQHRHLRDVAKTDDGVADSSVDLARHFGYSDR